MRLLSIQHPGADDPGVFGLAARADGHRYDEWCPADGAPAPADPASYDGIVVLGGAQNVEDGLPYLDDEIALVEEALAREQPVLGVCLGAQLLGVAAGGEVVRVREPEIGWFAVEALPAAARDPVFAELPPRFLAYCWHSYAVELPDDAVRLAETPACTHAFRIRETAWGVQFHPEVTREILLDWFATYREDPDAVALGFDPAAAEAQLDGRLEPWSAFGRRLFAAFTSAVDGQSATRTSHSSG